jgi:hypothetical protein
MLRHSEFSGVNWFIFEPRTIRIQEIRPYTAVPLQSVVARQELYDFDYEGRGYPAGAHCVTTTADLPGHKPLRNS